MVRAGRAEKVWADDVEPRVDVDRLAGHTGRHVAHQVDRTSPLLFEVLARAVRKKSPAIVSSVDLISFLI